MIFVTVGTQLPFDRLIKAIDEIAPSLNGELIIAQTKNSAYEARNIICREYLDRDEYRDLFKKARFVVAHAGMGSILTAFELQKNIIIMPRMAAFGEHRSDHQLSTAEVFIGYPNVIVAKDEDELERLIVNPDFPEKFNPCGYDDSHTLPESIKRFILKS